MVKINEKSFNKTLNTLLINTRDEYASISYCHKLHYCHNMNVMIYGLITLMLARYLSIRIALTRVTCIF